MIHQGPLFPASGYTFSSGNYIGNNWTSIAQPNISTPDWPTAISGLEEPDGTYGPYAHVRLPRQTLIESYSTMFALCGFNAQIPSNASISGIFLYGWYVASGICSSGSWPSTRNDMVLEALYITVSGSNNRPYPVGNRNYFIPSALTIGNPLSVNYVGNSANNTPNIYENIQTAWGLQNKLTPNDGPSGVNNWNFGIAFGVKALPLTGVSDPCVSGDVWWNNWQMYISYTIPPTTTSGVIPLFIGGVNTETSSIPLYVNGATTLNSGISLFVEGKSSGSTLFPLVTLGGPTGNQASGAMTLFSYGSPAGTGVAFNGMNLYVGGIPSSGFLPLFICADFPATGLLNLSISGGVLSKATSLDLMVYNNGIVSSVPLYISGQGYTVNPGLPYDPNGWIPFTGGMSLFIQRNDAEMVPMFIYGAARDSGNMPLYVGSFPTSVSGLSTYIRGLDSGNDAVRLYTHGSSN